MLAVSVSITATDLDGAVAMSSTNGLVCTHLGTGSNPVRGFKGPREREREMFYLTTHSTHFYGYMASDIWLRTILIVRNETRSRHIGYSYRLTARQGFFYMHHPTDRLANTTANVTTVVEDWLEREIAQ